jgi:hypothetical protein
VAAPVVAICGRCVGRLVCAGSVGIVSSSELEPTQWKVRGDRLVDENPFIRLSIASVELPDGTKFEQYVMRMRRTATTVVLDEQDRVLLMWRHRFITDQWVWELPGGYVDQGRGPGRCRGSRGGGGNRLAATQEARVRDDLPAHDRERGLAAGSVFRERSYRSRTPRRQ